MQRTILFEESDLAKRQVLAINGKGVDKEGFITEKSTGERVLSPAGREVTIHEFAGLRNGSVIVITNDLPSIIEQADYLEI